MSGPAPGGNPTDKPQDGKPDDNKPKDDVPKAKRYRVDSYHINVGTGDAAVHVLVAEFDGKADRAEKLVWVDSGHGKAKPMAQLELAFKKIPTNYANLPPNEIRFDSIIITHWDEDHCGAILDLYRKDTKNLEGKATKKLEGYLRTQSPNTRIFCASEKGGATKENPFNAILGKKRKTGDILQQSLKIGKLTADVIVGTGMIGTDVFSTNAVGTPDRRDMKDLDALLASFTPGAEKDADKPKDAEKPKGTEKPKDTAKPKDTETPKDTTNVTQDAERPLLIIVTVDEKVIGMDKKRLEAYKKAAVWEDPSTDTNKSSIGALIVWPTSRRVSHYFAGDLHYQHENVLAEWLSKTKFSGATTMKASHHGSASSTPVKLLQVLQPKNIIMSAGRDHRHPDWETIMAISSYIDKRKEALKRGPIILTRYPTWLKRGELAGSHKLSEKTDFISAEYFGDKSKAKKEVRGFLEVMEVENVALWAELKKAIVDFPKARKPADYIQAFSKVLAPRKANIFGNFVKPYELKTQKHLRWILVQSYSKLLDDSGVALDGRVSEKILNKAGEELVSEIVKEAPAALNEPQQVGKDDSVKRKRPISDSDVRMSDVAEELDARLEDVKVKKLKTERASDGGTTQPVRAGDDMEVTRDGDRNVPSNLLMFAMAAGPGTANTTATPLHEYSLCASHIAAESRPSSTNGRVLLETDPLDDFIDCLRAQALRLTNEPSADGAILDEKDVTFKWLKWVLDASEIRVRGSTSTVSAISVKVATKGMIFDTAFAGIALDSDASSSIWSTPGLLNGTSHTSMVFGLAPSAPQIWKSSEIFEFLAKVSGSGGHKTDSFMIHDICSNLDTTQWILGGDKDALKGGRNAVWFSPLLSYQTRLRLEFRLPPASQSTSGPLQLLEQFWPKSVKLDVKRESVKLICAYTSRIGMETAKSTDIRSNIQVSLVSTMVVTVGSSTITLEGIVALVSTGSVHLEIQSADKDNDFTGFGQALLKEMFAADTKFDSPGMPIPKEIQNGSDAFKFRSISLTLGKQGVEEANITMELKTSLGSKEKKNLSVRLVAGFRKGAPGMGMFLEGDLWFPAPEDPILPLSHFGDYEPFYHLEPWTPDALPFLSLAELLPDSADIVKGLPAGIPRYVTDASFNLTTESMSIYGLIESCAGYGHEVASGAKDHLPRLDFEELSLGATIVWETRQITFDLEFRIDLQAPPGMQSPMSTPVNQLIGSFSFDSGDASGGKSWQLSAEIQEFELGLLYDFFAPESRDLLYDILREIKIVNMGVSYGSQGGVSTFEAHGDFLIAKMESTQLSYVRRSDGVWSIDAALETQILSRVTLADIAASIFGPGHEIVTGLPDFLAEIQMLGPGIENPSLKLHCAKDGEDGVKFTLEASISKLSVTFVQLHNQKRRSGEGFEAAGKAQGPIRFFKLSCKHLQIPGTKQNQENKPPLLNELELPFDEIGFSWVNSDLDEKQVAAVYAAQAGSSPLAAGPAIGAPTGSAGMTRGFHFVVLSEGAAIIDYPLGKTRSSPRKIEGTDNGSLDAPSDADKPAGGETGPPTAVDARSPKAPVKKSSGLLTINHIQLHYKESNLSIQMDAVFSVGPLMFALFGFQIGMDFSGGASLESLDIKKVTVSIDGMAASFKKPPLTLEGGLIHKKTTDEDIFAGGITIGFVPWLFQAAGFYGKKRKPNSAEFFTSALVYAILRGPLITLEFATISGITGGFGYNVGINKPSVGEVYRFPFTKSQSNEDDDIVTTLNNLIGKVTPPDKQWFFPEEGSMWLACGLTVSAFEMLDVTAVLIAQWSPQLQFHVLGLASADIPNAKSKFKIAHVELGFLASIDVTTGLFSVEAQLTPNSYILDPSCHLSGGFALYYWFKSTAVASAGDFVLTLGGYHDAYQKPDNYPRPPRLAISWALGNNLSISGQAYFAITPKVCMAGMHIKAVLTLGDLRAWFDAYADFLVNYAPFKFTAEVSVSVGVSYNFTLGFIHKHIGVEIGATLKLFGPPIAGIVHVDFYVFGFDIEFGDRSKQIGDGKLTLEKFYSLVLEMDSKVAARAAKSDRPHVYACLGGLLANKTTAEVKEDEPWEVRGGPFSYAINSHFAIGKAKVNGVDVPPPSDGNGKDKIYAKPMRLQSEMSAELTVTVKDSKGSPVTGWKLEPIMKSVPSGLWGYYDPAHDPLTSGNNVGELLSNSGSPVRLMMGVQLKAPEPRIAAEKLLPFDIKESMVETLHFDKSNMPHIPPAKKNFRKQSIWWTPAKPIPVKIEGIVSADDSSEEEESDSDEETHEDDKIPPTLPTDTATNQWEAVREAWQKSNPSPCVEAWASVMPWKTKKDGAGKTLLPLRAGKPEYMIKRIPELFLEAPRLCAAVAG